MRKHFEERLNILNESMIDMGNIVSEQIKDSMRALMNKDLDLAKKVMETDSLVNSKEKDIETLCLKILLKEQPVASDLRFVTSALKMITDLERIGDQAADISYLNIKITTRDYDLVDLGSAIQMAKITSNMVNDAIKAYVTGDVDLAVQVIERDKEVNRYFSKVREEVVKDIKDDKFHTKSSLDILMIGKYLERIGDHCENIARRVYFSLKGKHLEK